MPLEVAEVVRSWVPKTHEPQHGAATVTCRRMVNLDRALTFRRIKALLRSDAASFSTCDARTGIPDREPDFDRFANVLECYFDDERRTLARNNVWLRHADADWKLSVGGAVVDGRLEYRAVSGAKIEEALEERGLDPDISRYDEIFCNINFRRQRYVHRLYTVTLDSSYLEPKTYYHTASISYDASLEFDVLRDGTFVKLRALLKNCLRARGRLAVELCEDDPDGTYEKNRHLFAPREKVTFLERDFVYNVSSDPCVYQVKAVK